MKKMKVMMMAAAMLLGGAMLKADTMTGVVTDTMCGLNHSGKPADKCTAGCVKKGSTMSLVVGDKVYEMKGKTEGMEALGGATVKVSGKLAGNILEVDSYTK
jgi:hypothetical protein